MGAWLPNTIKNQSTSPKKYQPESSLLVRRYMTAEILRTIDESGLTSRQIQKRYPGFRLGYLRAMRDGELLGFSRLCSILEVLASYPVVVFVGRPAQQAELMELMEAA